MRDAGRSINYLLQGHHIKSFKDYPELRLAEDNIVVLCRVCNLQVGDSSVVDW
ncbi:HNH endonuclease [Cellulosilyticum sp. ST5]|uniref:HNH endonuclease n=1 Tax=Cellulosilyticum sp. ST5 TaxID=3055805 RepID=UPI0039778A4F